MDHIAVTKMNYLKCSHHFILSNNKQKEIKNIAKQQSVDICKVKVLFVNQFPFENSKVL